MNTTPKTEATACLSSMLRTETRSFPNSGVRSDDIDMKNLTRHTIPLSVTSRVRLGPPAHSAELFGEWQQRGPETFSGHVLRKLRLTLAPPQSVVAANVPGWEELP